MNLNVKVLGFILLSSQLFSGAQAQVNSRKNPLIYPFVPMPTAKILGDAERFSEDESFIKNVYDIEYNRLSSGKPFLIDQNGSKKNNQPWMSTYWPLNQGMIGSWFTHKSPYNPLNTRRTLDWKHNYRKFQDRKSTLHKNINNKDANGNFIYTSATLNSLAPSEKYDMLLGDENFDLTNRVWEYMEKWGSEKEHGFIASLDKVGGQSVGVAKGLVAQGKYQTVLAAMPEAIELKGGLAEYFAQRMVKQGRYTDVVSALPEGMTQALANQDNYTLKRKNSMMALWEGICHGWATAAGIVPRPLRTVTLKLHDGRSISFLPDDLKAIASLLWANSLIQDGKFEPSNTKGEKLVDNNGNNAITGGIIMQGLRCNEKRPSKDNYGRFYDEYPDAYSKRLEPRCVGVHPATWHMGLVNVMGKQGRSFIVERKVKAAVDNHPLSSYRMEYFNPYNGDYGSLSNSVQPITQKDQFFDYRNPEARLIVGVRVHMTYTKWKRPDRNSFDNPNQDETQTKEMMYDLELTQDGDIIGGQWRVKEKGKPFLRLGGKRTQPDFFWTVTKHWKRAGEVKGVSKAYFAEKDTTSEWTDTSVAPPADWLMAAKLTHGFMYQKSSDLGWYEKCELLSKNGRGGLISVPCEFSINRPQPLVNVVNKLIELSRK